MPVPSSISQLNVTAGQNSPVGSEAIGNNLSPYLQSHAAFIAQIANGTGITMTQALSMNGYQVNNIAAGTANTDAINLQQLKTYEPIGTIKLWYGTATNAAVQAAWGTNWALCNGANGTPNLLDRFVIAAGGSYGTGAVGGTTSYALSVANMPSHTHGVNDPGHAHGVYDPGHAHGVADYGHNHNNGGYSRLLRAPYGGSLTGSDTNGSGSEQAVGAGDSADIVASGSNIGIYGAGTGIGIYGAGTGIYLSYTGSGAAFTVIPPYYALCYVMKIASN
ncbi:hypothetical protein [Caballeronia zhejiangensis]|uniref:hypothetical protein n=1 Tax=Caballeronia zhejiangensis TaxID=871203 RepID=UPI001F5251F8|nr:hypothetical protein [Caballeronia zhejiangensis]MCI1046916.1 hypothetical protein [Caballeronia zhejiangensis]